MRNAEFIVERLNNVTTTAFEDDNTHYSTIFAESKPTNKNRASKAVQFVEYSLNKKKRWQIPDQLEKQFAKDYEYRNDFVVDSYSENIVLIERASGSITSIKDSTGKRIKTNPSTL